MRNTLKHSQVFLKIGAPNEKILENETTCKVPSSRHAANIYSRYFRKNLVILLENLLQREFDVAVFMVRGILLGNVLWVVNT